MNEYKIDDKYLKQKLEPFDFTQPPIAPDILASKLASAMITLGGIGLAANQIGWPYRVFALQSSPILVCFNPRIVETSTELIQLEEGCLSYPGVFVKKKRPKVIRVRFQDYNGDLVTKQFDGITARVFQHELDHLNGICMIDDVSPLKKKMIGKRMMKIKHRVEKNN